MFFGLGGRVHDSQNQLLIILETPRHIKQFKTRTESIFEKYFRESQHWGNICFENVGKDRGRTILKIRLINS